MQTEYEIEEGIPIPRNKTYTKYGLHRLTKPGMSLFFPSAEITMYPQKGKAYPNLYSCASVYARRHGVKLVCRQVEKEGVTGYRVWRIA